MGSGAEGSLQLCSLMYADDIGGGRGTSRNGTCWSKCRAVVFQVQFEEEQAMDIVGNYNDKGERIGCR